ncbi:MAG: GNAT family N-acetyltransferase [Eubacterium sp.]|nr:GNAT family N-acetyltransferase [Eubacterium sp.]
MEIREARVEDAKGICVICSEDLGYLCEPCLVEEKLKNLDSEREAVFVAVSDENAVMGYIHIERCDTLYLETMGNILGLAVKSSCRRNGIGRRLVAEAESWAKHCGIKLMRLNSGFSRKAAHEFYRNLGYGSEKEQIRFMKKII